MIDVVLLTCERYDYTLRTIETFLKYNKDLGRFRLWHCDDASQDHRINVATVAYGFYPLVRTQRRVGVTGMIRAAAAELLAKRSSWMLLLENDWETARTFPWQVFDAIEARGDVYSLRLYGQFKDRGQLLPAGTRHRGRKGADPQWESFDGYEVGDIHWGNPPAVSQTRVVNWLHRDVSTEKQVILRSGSVSDKVARVTQNVVYHIGHVRTPEFKA